MKEDERSYWRSLKGTRCRVNYDPPNDTAIIVGVRRGASNPANDMVVVRFDDGSRLSIRPHQVLSVSKASQLTAVGSSAAPQPPRAGASRVTVRGQSARPVPCADGQSEKKKGPETMNSEMKRMDDLLRRKAELEEAMQPLYQMAADIRSELKRARKAWNAVVDEIGQLAIANDLILVVGNNKTSARAKEQPCSD